MTFRSLPWSFALAMGLVPACGDDEKPPPPGTSTPNRGGETGGGTSGASGASGSSGSGGTTSGGGEAGDGTGGTGAEPQGGNAGSGGTNAPGGEGGAPTGGSAGSGGSGASGGSGIPPCDSDTDPEPPPDVMSLCVPEGGFGPGVDIPLMDGAARLVGITPDELTIAWYADVMMDTQFHVADRSAVTSDFGTPEELPDRDYVALSPDGLRLVGFDGNGRFVEVVRSARGQAFGEPSEGAFATLNAHAGTNDLVFLGAVISPDDSELYYLAQGTDDQPLHVSRRAGTGAWPVGEKIAACEFRTHGALVRRPTGISADGLTLFYEDAVRGLTRAAWREEPDGEFVWFADVGSQRDAQPNADCSRLYFTASGGPSYSDAE